MSPVGPLPIRRIACLLVGCRPVRVPFAEYKGSMLAALSGSCVTPTLQRCDRCGQLKVVD